MPNPKAGTVTTDVEKAVEEAKGGKVEYRTDRTGERAPRDRQGSFDARALLENYAAVLEEIIRAKPSAAKGRYIRTMTFATTRAPASRSIPRGPATSSRRRRLVPHPSRAMRSQQATTDLRRPPGPLHPRSRP